MEVESKGGGSYDGVIWKPLFRVTIEVTIKVTSGLIIGVTRGHL